jgi:hypothetical protein
LVRNNVGGPAFDDGLFRGTVPSDAGEGARDVDDEEEEEEEEAEEEDEEDDDEEEPRW